MAEGDRTGAAGRPQGAGPPVRGSTTRPRAAGDTSPLAGTSHASASDASSPGARFACKASSPARPAKGTSTWGSPVARSRSSVRVGSGR